jgi:Family of unknown function (DUF6525)
VTQEKAARRRVVVMACFDKLPRELREWIQSLPFNLHDDHILQGEKEVRRCVECVRVGNVYYKQGANQN